MNQQNPPAVPSSRREFLAASSVALAASAALAPSVLAQDSSANGGEKKKRPWKKAVMHGMLPKDLPFMDQMKLLKDTGFHGVELNAPGGPPPEKVREACEATGMAISGVVDSTHWRIPLSDANPGSRAIGQRDLQQALRDCKAYGGTSVLLVPAVVNKQVSYADAWERSTEEIKKALPVAEETGIKIAVENVWNNFLLSPLEAARYVDQFNSPWVGWHFDIGNIVHYGWPEHWIQALNKRILKLHVKEFSRKLAEEKGRRHGFSAELLEGDNDWPAVMKALDEVGYAGGWMTLEVGGGGKDRLQFLSERLDRILAS